MTICGAVTTYANVHTVSLQAKKGVRVPGVSPGLPVCVLFGWSRLFDHMPSQCRCMWPCRPRPHGVSTLCVLRGALEGRMAKDITHPTTHSVFTRWGLVPHSQPEQEQERYV